MGEPLPSPSTARCAICGKLSWMCPHPWEARMPMEKWEATHFEAICRSCRTRWGQCGCPIDERALIEDYDAPRNWPPSAKRICELLGVQQEQDVDAMIEHEKGREARERAAAHEEDQRRKAMEPYELFCDGSGTTDDQACGAGVVLYRWGKTLAEGCYPLGLGTNNFAEIAAIGRGLRMLLDKRGDRNGRVVVKTDSEFAIGAIRVGSTWNVNPGLEKLVAAARKEVEQWPNLRFEHVQGHVGIPQNERADKLAKRARRLVIQQRADAEGRSRVIADYDTETTGTHPNCQILSAFISIRKGREILNEYEVRLLLQDWARVEQQALDVNGIDPYSDDWKKSAMSYEEGASVIAQALSQAEVICAHNAQFDISRTKSMLQRTRVKFPDSLNNKPICTMQMARMLKNKGMIDSMKLGTVCEYYGIPYKDAHTSRGDVYSMRRVLRPLYDDYELLKS